LNEPINITISYGEYVKSAIPREVFVPLPHVNKNKFVWVPLTLLLGSAFLTHIGIRLIPWILIGELFAPNVRSGGSGLAGGIAYIFGFIANKTFLKMLAVFTLPGTFWIYSLITIVGAMILYKVLPETEGKSLQEIETYFLSGNELSARIDQEAPAPPRPGPKISTSSLQSVPPPIPPKPYPLKDDIDRARRISLVPRQMSQSSRNTTVSDFSRASFHSQRSNNASDMSRNSSWTSYTLEDSQDQPHPQLFRKISETLPDTIVVHQLVKVPKPSLSKQKSTTAPICVNDSVALPTRKISCGKQTILTTPNDLKLSIHKTQPMNRPVRALAKRPPPSHQFDFQSCESNRKFEEFLHRYQDTSDGTQITVKRPMRHVTSAHDLKAFEKSHLPGTVIAPPNNGGMLTDRKMFNSATKLTSTYLTDDVESPIGGRGTGVDNAVFHLSSSDESTDM
uniref:Major facilitator superfamily (MFS) profile domain-containing protein n=1 Tax=Anopheles maculatus TaxID=74869 RepID=A0A182SQJ1_9DIPT